MSEEKYVNTDANPRDGEEENQKQTGRPDAREKWQQSLKTRGERPKMERVIDMLNQTVVNNENNDYQWRHLDDRRGAMGHIYHEKQPGSQNKNKPQIVAPSVSDSPSRHSYSVMHQSPQNVQYPPKLPPIEPSKTFTQDSKISDSMLKSMLKYGMNVRKLLHQKQVHPSAQSTGNYTSYVGRSPQSSIESLPVPKERSTSQHRCAKSVYPTPHVDEFGPPPPKEEYHWSNSKHSMHRRVNQIRQQEEAFPKFSRFANESGGSLSTSSGSDETKVEKPVYHKLEEKTQSQLAYPRVITRDKGVQVALIMGSPLRPSRTFSELDQSSSPSVITQICAVDKKKKTGNTIDLKKPSLYSTRTAASSITTSVFRQNTNSVLSMRPTVSAAHYIYNMKHKEADKRSIGNVMQNFFDLGSQKSSARLMNTVIGEVSNASLESSVHEYRIARQKVDKNPRAGMNCLRLLIYDMKLWWKRLKRKQEENPIFAGQIKAIEGHFGSGIVSFFVFLRWLVSLNALFASIWLLFIVFPQIGAFESKSNATFYTIDIFTGEGALENSWLFYGSYTEMVGVYPLALLYLLAIIITFFGGFFLVLRSLACAIEDEGVNLKSTPYTFLTLLFSAWDYSLTSREAARNLSLGIANTFREVIREMEVRKVLESQSKKEKVDLYGRRCLAWIITFFFVTLGVTIIFLVVSSDLETLLTKWGYKVTNESFVILYGPVIIFIFINVTIPEVIYPLPRMERYSRGKEEIHITVARVFVLRIFNVLALVVSLIQKVKQTHYEGCAGTLIAQELYKLVLIDTVVGIFTVMVPHYVKFYWYGEKQEFDMPPQVLKVIYRQAVIWLGTLVSPIMPLIGVLSGVVFFVSNHVMVMHTCKPPEKRWNQPRRSTFFMVLTAVTLLVLIILVSIIIGRSDFVLLGQMGRDNTDHCGPFKNQTMTTVFVSWQKQMKVEYPSMGAGIEVLLSGTVIMPAILIMLALLYFQKLRIGWEKKHSCQLFAELEQERVTNIELMKRIHQNVPFG